MTPEVVPVYRAALPAADRLLPYLTAIDRNRWYTNRGELVQDLEARLTRLVCAAGTAAITAASGTAAIVAAILATAGRATAARPLAMLPAYTFIATVAAVEQCGYVPYLVDVDPDTWALEPESLLEHPVLPRAGVVIPVAPYGRAVAQAGWTAFARRASVAVVIDAAAGFEALTAQPRRCTGVIPVAVSFQATKAFSCGEGGAVFWSDGEGLARVVRALNFGILHKRESASAGTNGKLSEYHAAVGLAALDGWAATAASNRAVAYRYRRAASNHGLGARVFVAPDVASNYALLDAGTAQAANAVVAALSAQGIESRWWYGRGLHREPYLQDAQRDALTVTDRIAPVLVGLPIACDIAADDIERTIEIAAHVLGTAHIVPANAPAPLAAVAADAWVRRAARSETR